MHKDGKLGSLAYWARVLERHAAGASVLATVILEVANGVQGVTDLRGSNAEEWVRFENAVEAAGAKYMIEFWP